jgi:hypothetical protein
MTAKIKTTTDALLTAQKMSKGETFAMVVWDSLENDYYIIGKDETILQPTDKIVSRYYDGKPIIL